MSSIPHSERVQGALWGALVGDALGVPVEFYSRTELQRTPVTDLRAHGSHDQPLGTWSDDSSLAICTVDSLVHHAFDIGDMGHRFLKWYSEGLWCPWGKVFDIGGTTREALRRIANGTPPEQAGLLDEYSNGNGSLMRIHPVALRFAREPSERLLEYAHRVSAITHAHPRSQMACGFLCLMLAELLAGKDAHEAHGATARKFQTVYQRPPCARELQQFQPLIAGKLQERLETEISSGGYCVHTLIASVWCLLTTASYTEAVLKAVNLGGDSDTTGTVTGALAGAHYGIQSVPKSWRQAMARGEELRGLFERFGPLCSCSA